MKLAPGGVWGGVWGTPIVLEHHETGEEKTPVILTMPDGSRSLHLTGIVRTGPGFGISKETLCRITRAESMVPLTEELIVAMKRSGEPLPPTCELCRDTGKPGGSE